MTRSLESLGGRNRNIESPSEGSEYMSFEEHMATRSHEKEGHSIEKVKSILDEMDEDVDPEIREAIEATRKATQAEAINEAREGVLNSFNRTSEQPPTSNPQPTPVHSLESLGNSNNLDTPRDLEGINIHSNTPPSSTEPDSTSDPNSSSSHTDSELDQASKSFEELLKEIIS